MLPPAIKGYQFIKMIGTGGGGEVWLVEKNNKQFAIKIPKILAHQTLSYNEIKDFLKKAELWSKLNHPNIVKVYDFGSTPIPYIVMELCDYDLRSKLGKLTLEEILTIIIKIADALKYAHSHNVVHNDIKPENVLFKNGEPKIGDWGIARILLDVTTKTNPAGTPLYSAPEQLNPDTFGSIDRRTDIWQFGCLLYELFEKSPPFRSEYLGKLVISILSEKPAQPTKTPIELKSLLLKCLEKRKENRWSSMDIILNVLNNYRTKIFAKGKKKRKRGAVTIEKKPSDKAQELYNKGASLAKLKQYEEAIKYYDKAIKINPNNATIWNAKGSAYVFLGRYNKAIKCFDKAIEIDPNYADPWYNKGVILDELGRYEEAIKCYNNALKNKPDDADAWYNKGLALRKLGRYEEAIECYDKAIEINPIDSSAWINKSFIFINLGRYYDAIDCCDKAIEINPNDATAWNNKSNALNALGKYNAAIYCLDKALEINPNYANAWYNKGIALEALKQYKEALICFNKTLEINPNHDEASDRMKKILKMLKLRGKKQKGKKHR